MNINRTVESKSYLRYLEQKHSGKYGNSSFWMDGLVTRSEDADSKFDILKMVRYQRAISNFVKILGKKDIPVVFSTGGRSYTDGKTKVVLSANIDEKSFDVHAGLALHESSHILHTDFDTVTDWFPGRASAGTLHMLPKSKLRTYAPNIYASIYTVGSPKRQLPWQFTPSFMYGICNFIEDRRIDNLVFKSSPGYKTYYHSLYKTYFWNTNITKGLKSDEFRTEDVDSYEFRILGLINPATDPNALKGLRAIINKLDLQNIDRLTHVKDSCQLAYEVCDIIAKYLLMEQERQHQLAANSQQNQPGNGAGNGTSGGTSDEDTNGDDMRGGVNTPSDINVAGIPSDSTTTDSGTNSDNTTSSDSTTTGGNSKDADVPKLNSAELDRLVKKIGSMKDVINGNAKKTKASKDVARMTGVIAGNTDYEIASVEYDGDDSNIKYQIPVLEFNLNPGSFSRVDDPIIDAITISSNLEDWMRWYYASRPAGEDPAYQVQYEVVTAGLQLGTQLGRKLQLRDQVRDTKHTRLKTGKIDGRLLHQCGYDVMNIFQKIDLDKFTPNVIHISIDASSSMAGPKWYKTQTAVLAIAKAASMIQNIAVEISYRYNFAIGDKNSAILVNAYNSKKHKIDHMAKVALLLTPRAYTVDSLCIRYQLNKKRITPGSSEVKSYFINFSDGAPGCIIATSTGICRYAGTGAHKHIERCRRDMEAMNINILSYFIGTSTSPMYTSKTVQQFKEDWGNSNASFINVTEIVPLAKSLNQMFLSK